MQWDENQWRKLASTDVIVVQIANLSEAVDLVQGVSWTELSAEQVSRLGNVLPKTKKAYLLRGVAFEEVDASVTVYEFKNSLHVHHGTLSSGGLTMKKQPVIVLLPNDPVAVYATCTAAQ